MAPGREIAARANASGNGAWLGMFTAEEATNGQAIGTTTFDYATASYKNGFIIALRDTGGPPTVSGTVNQVLIGSGILVATGTRKINGTVSKVLAARVCALQVSAVDVKRAAPEPVIVTPVMVSVPVVIEFSRSTDCDGVLVLTAVAVNSSSATLVFGVSAR